MARDAPIPDVPKTSSPEQADREAAIGRRGYLILAFVLVAAALTASFLLPDLRTFRYASEYRDFATPAFCDDRDVDVVFLGTSRMARAIDGRKISEAFAARTGRPLSIVDLSQPGQSPFVWRRLLADQLENRRVKLVVAELGRPIKPPRSTTLKKIGNVLPTVEFVDYVGRNKNEPRVQGLLPAVQARLGSLEAGLGNPWRGCPDALPDDGVYDSTQSRYKLPKAFKDAEGLKKRSRNPVDKIFSDNGYAFIREVAEALTETARENGAQIVFMNLNDITQRTVSPQIKTAFQQNIGAELVSWPNALNQELRTGMFYADPEHLDESGSRLVAPWLAKVIDRHLSARP